MKKYEPKYRKMTVQKVAEILTFLDKGLTRKEIACCVEQGLSTVSRINQGRKETGSNDPMTLLQWYNEYNKKTSSKHKAKGTQEKQAATEEQENEAAIAEFFTELQKCSTPQLLIRWYSTALTQLSSMVNLLYDIDVQLKKLNEVWG